MDSSEEEFNAVCQSYFLTLMQLDQYRKKRNVGESMEEIWYLEQEKDACYVAMTYLSTL